MGNDNHDERGRFATADQLDEGAAVKVTGKVNHQGKSGTIHSFGSEKRFVVVKLKDGTLASFHSSDVTAKVARDSHVKAAALIKEQGTMPSTVEEAKAKIKALKAQIKKVNAETKAIDNKLKAEDHKNDATGEDKAKAKRIKELKRLLKMNEYSPAEKAQRAGLLSKFKTRTKYGGAYTIGDQEL